MHKLFWKKFTKAIGYLNPIFLLAQVNPKDGPKRVTDGKQTPTETEADIDASIARIAKADAKKRKKK